MPRARVPVKDSGRKRLNWEVLRKGLIHFFCQLARYFFSNLQIENLEMARRPKILAGR